MKHNFPVDGSSRRIPIRRLSKIGNLFQIVHAVDVGENLLRVPHEVWKNVVDVPCALKDVTKDYVNVNWEICSFEAIAAEARESLLLKYF